MNLRRAKPNPAAGWIRGVLRIAGPGFMVSVGYMDPGNWGTDIAGGAQYGYALLWVILISSIMAMVLQVLSARLGLVTGKDLAQLCRERYPLPMSYMLWILAEIAIIACDVAEVIGSAVALKLLFGIPLLFGVLITSADVLMLLALSAYGLRRLEAVVFTLIATISICFGLELFWARPVWMEVGQGIVIPHLADKGALVLAVAILGATVMPHNLYLHSGLVQERRPKEITTDSLRDSVRFNTADTLIALGIAFFVNAAILVVAGAQFHARGHFGVAELEEAYTLLKPLLGTGAATVFAVALLASGQSSTITGTYAGQIVMEGFLKWRIAPWKRRLITRTLAVIPAAALIALSGGKNTVGLLVFSQIVLSMQLSFAVVPLVAFTSSRKVMGDYANSTAWRLASWLVAAMIAGLNLYLLIDMVGAAWVIGGSALLAALGVWAMRFRPLAPA